jgi:hypothetical protein
MTRKNRSAAKHGNRACERGRFSKVVFIIAVATALAATLAVSGCGAPNPQTAVQNFYKAIENHDWNAYLSAVAPENVKRMTAQDRSSQKKKFESTGFKYEGVKYKAIIDKKNPDKASVELTDGVIKGKNQQTGQQEATTIAQIKKDYGITPALDTIKYKGRWYVDVPLASADQPTQQQL